MRSSKKNTNPKDAVGVTKAPFSTVSGPAWALVGLAMLEGALKYGRHNYRVAGVRASVYYDAKMRHSVAFWEGQDIDPDSGIHHLAKSIASDLVLLDSIIQGNWVDDRPPRTANAEGWMRELNAKVKALLKRYPKPVASFTQLGLTSQAKRRRRNRRAA